MWKDPKIEATISDKSNGLCGLCVRKRSTANYAECREWVQNCRSIPRRLNGSKTILLEFMRMAGNM